MDWFAAILAFIKALLGIKPKDPMIQEDEDVVKAKTEEVKVMEAPDRTKLDILNRMRERSDH